MRGHVEDELMDTPTIAQTAQAFRTALAGALADVSGVSIVPETASFNPDASGIFALQAFRPSTSESAELSGRLGLGKRHGVYMVTLSAPFASAKVADAMSAAETLADAFRRRALPTANGPVYTDEPNIFVVGKDPDERYSISISVPYTAWTGGVE